MSTNRGLDPRISLATALHAQDGVYALLLGSGVSTGAGVATGWGVVTELTRRAAAAGGETELGEDFDAEAWWAEHGDGQPLGYSSLLEALASTPAARRQLLAGFFEASEDDREAGEKVPGPAHKAVAELVRRDSVRVIVTTNFDRLIEQALTDAGVQHQVVSSVAGIAGMEPLPHARCTVVKLHGDYAQLDQLNTVEELSTYAPEMGELLARILDEYGLVINGWSADWDRALVEAIQGARSRRYPLYWTSRSAPGAAASELVARHRAVTIDGASADEFFPDLVSRLEALDSLRAPQMTQAMAIAQLKRWLPDPIHHIRVHDLVMDEVARVVAAIEERPKNGILSNGAVAERAHDELRDQTELLLRLVSTGIYFDRERVHTDLWVQVVQRLLRAKKVIFGEQHSPGWWNLEHYPALLTLYVGVAASVAANREDVAIRMLSEPTYKDPTTNMPELPACHALHHQRVLDSDKIEAFPCWRGRADQLVYPASELLRRSLKGVLESVFQDTDPAVLLSRTEYRIALGQEVLQREAGTHYPASGVFVLRGDMSEGNFSWENDFNKRGDVIAWAKFVGDTVPFQASLVEAQACLVEAQAGLRSVFSRYGSR